MIASVEKEVQEQLKTLVKATTETEKDSPEEEKDSPEEEKGPSWGETIMNDLKTEGKLPDWIKFMDKFMPPSVKAALAVLETVQAITDNKDLIVDTGKKYIEVKLTEERRALEDQAKGQIPVPAVPVPPVPVPAVPVPAVPVPAVPVPAVPVPEVPQQGGAFTYEDCVF